MRYRIDPRPPQRNLSAGKRSIVLACASIAMVLGTTSVGSSFIDDAQTQALPPSSSIPTTTQESDSAPTLQSTSLKTLGRQRPLILNKPELTPVKLPLESVPDAAAAVLIQLSKHAVIQPPTKIVAPTTSTPPATTNQANTPPATEATPPTPTTPEVVPPSTDTPPSTEPPTDTNTTEPPLQTFLDSAPTSRSDNTNEAL